MCVHVQRVNVKKYRITKEYLPDGIFTATPKFNACNFATATF